MKYLRFALVGLAWLALSAVSLAQDSGTAAEILADLEENNLSAEELQGVQQIPSLRVVALDALSGADRQRLEETLRETEDGFAEVQTAIARNEVLDAALRERGVPIASIAAATRSEEGAITVYTTEEPPR